LDWNSPQTYIDIIGSEAVSIATTEDGLADSVQVLESGKEIFVKPLNEEMTLEDFMKRLGLSQGPLARRGCKPMLICRATRFAGDCISPIARWKHLPIPHPT
jgi:hypothetical protein